MSSSHPFDTLLPGFIEHAIESKDFWCDGRTFALNSYENRVYQVGIEEQEPLIAKFYRPGRWSTEQILEEHAFTAELAEADVSVVTPWQDEQGETLFEYEGFRFSLYPRRGGHAPELDNMDHLFILGRTLGRIHAIGAASDFKHRPIIDVKSYGEDSVEIVREYIPADLTVAYESLTADLLGTLNQRFENLDVPFIRCHGDCHIGNMLWRDDVPHFIDFDDARMAPAIQDIWMLLSSNEVPEQNRQLLEIMEGYNEFYDFPLNQLILIEPLRTLRLMHHSAWLAKRWDDPAFPHAFPWFNTQRYWEEHVLQLREQQYLLQQPPLNPLGY